MAQNSTEEQRRTKEAKKKLLKALVKAHGIIYTACKKSKVPRRTVYNWLESDKEFKKAVEETDELIVDLAENVLEHHLKKKDKDIAKFIAKTKGKKRGYTEKHEFDHTGDLNHKVVTEITIAPSPKKKK